MPFDLSSFVDGHRVAFETKMMAEYLVHERERIETFSVEQDAEFQEQVFAFYEKIDSLFDSDSILIAEMENIRKLLGRYNSHRLQQTGEGFVSELVSMAQKYKMGLLPPPMPSEYLSEEPWLQDNAKWIGHGYYWKSGEGEMCKDLSFSDYDALEDKFRPLTQAKVLTADYEVLKNDFECLQGKTNEQIDEWMIKQSAFISEGQIKRCSPGGDMYDLIEDITGKFDDQTSKIGVRMKGGGRAATFLVDDKYDWSEDGLFQADMIEAKGIGTSILQPEIEQKACGFLSLVDALKEFAYEKLIHEISEREKQEWGTVQYYAIIDTGMRYKSNCANPATGYKGDRCVLVLRQRQSRIVSCPDEIVYYSVVRRDLLEQGRGKAFCSALSKYGVSSEQIPSSLFSPGEFTLAGDWNVQSDASLTHIVDFSHFFVLPSSPLHDNWKLSENDVQEALLLGAEHFGVFSNANLMKLIDCNGDDENSVRRHYEERIVDLGKKFEEFGSIGRRKPSYSWSWFLEVDNSPIMKWALDTGTKPVSSNSDTPAVMNMISNLLKK